MLPDSFDRIANVLETLRTRLWLIPAVMSLAAAVAARVAVGLDGSLAGFGYSNEWWWFGGTAATARDLLSTLLSGMITMTSLVISITMVVLSVAASQLGPRLIWSFVRDRQIQFVIGLFFATIVYVLVAMRSIDEDLVPEIAVSIATVLVALCLFALLFHIHKVARSIIADTVVAEVAAELLAAIDAIPEDCGGDLPEESGRRTTTAAVTRAGYVQVVEYRRLAHIAEDHDLHVVLRVRAGQYLLPAGEHLEIRHRGDLPPEVVGSVQNAVIIGRQRTPTQDIEYSVRQLVEIGVRALSPGINDPFTAISVVHRLAEGIERLMDRDFAAYHAARDSHDVVRVRGQRSTFQGVVDAAYNQMRQAAANGRQTAVLVALVSVLGQLSVAARSPDQRDAIMEHLEKVSRAAAKAIEDPMDRADFEAAHAAALRNGRG